MSAANHNTQHSDDRWMATLSSAVAAALTLAVFFGLADSIASDLAGFAPESGSGRLGCYAATIGWYGLMFASILVPAAVVTHASWREQPRSIRLRRWLTLGLFVALYLEIAGRWWPENKSPGASAEVWGTLGAMLLGAALGAWLLARVLMRLPRALHLASRVLGVAALIGGVWFVREETQRLDDLGRINERNEGLPNVLVVVADSLRTGHLGCYGAKTGLTPNLDELAERGVVVDTCIVQSATTRASLASILSGQYPRRRPLAQEIAGSPWRAVATLERLASTSTLSESGLRLRADDYVTAHFDGQSDAERGLGERFGAKPSPWHRFQSGLPLRRMERELETWLTPAPAEESAIAWMREHGDRRWMARVSLDLVARPGRVNSGGQFEEVAHLDERFGSLVDQLTELGLLETTLIVFTAAQGDPAAVLGQANLHVPLLLANTRLLPHGKRVTDLVESIDLVPTLCDLVGLELPTSKDDLLLDGRSFVTAILGTQRGETSSFVPKRYAFSESADSLSIQTLEAQLIVPRELVDEEDRRRFFRELERARYIDLQAGPEDPIYLETFQDRRLSEMWSALREYDARMPTYVNEVSGEAKRAHGEVQAMERGE